MEELREFLNSVQRPRLKDSAWMQVAHLRCQELQDRFMEARAAMATRSQKLASSAEEMVECLREWSVEFRSRPRRRNLDDLTRRLGRNYEAMLESAKAWGATAGLSSRKMVHLKPVNYWRNVFHVMMGLSAVGAAEFVFTWQQCGFIMIALTAIVATLESLRRFLPGLNRFLVQKLFGPVSRPRELYRMNGASWFVFATTLLVLFFPKWCAELGVLVLAVADPAATLAGKAWGRHKLYRQKSIVGTVAFFLTALAGTVLFGQWAPETSWPVLLGLAGSVALIGTAGELFSDRLDDNFTIPLLCAGVATLWVM